MANEIQQQIRITVNNGTFKESVDPGSKQIDQAAIGKFGGIFEIGTSEEDIAFSELTTAGIAVMQNLDPTNYVTYGPKSGGVMIPFGELKPGEAATFRLDRTSTLIRAQANTAACNVLITVYED